jgi:hypothetical protein
MKALSIAGFAVAAILVAMAPALTAIYREAYPAEAGKREALAACAVADPGFNRLFAKARARCYSRLLPAPQEPPPLVPREQLVAVTGR